MAFCKDHSLTYLNRFGYNVVRLPRQGIETLDVLGKERSLQRLGRLSSVWKTSRPEPTVSGPRPVADLDGQKSDDLDLSVGLKILQAALRGLGADATIEFAYKRARKVQFTFTNVLSFTVDPLDAGNYLASGDLDLANDVVVHYFTNEETQAFLITEVLKSDTVTVTAKSDRGAELAVDVGAVTAAIGGKVSVSAGRANGATLSYKGSTPVTFGFKAFAIAYVSGRWRLRGVEASGDLAFALSATPDDELGNPVVFPSGLITISL